MKNHGKNEAEEKRGWDRPSSPDIDTRNTRSIPEGKKRVRESGKRNSSSTVKVFLPGKEEGLRG